MLRNVARLRAHLDRLGVTLRPHLKTVKSVDAARRILKDGTGPATVSTLREAEVFAEAGVRDITYAVGIAPAKLDRVLAIRATGCDLAVVLDNADQARAVAEASRRSGDRIPAYIEIDSDGHRSGLAFAELERQGVVTAAETLRAAGLPCPVVSVGSTPTAHFARDLTGVTEVRAGVFTLFDLVMAGIGVCTTDDIALSVLTTVIGHQRERGWIITDAGWMAMSRDRGTANQAVDQGYGVVCDVDGRVMEDLIVRGANQEHGIIAVRAGSGATLPDLPVGTLLRILPHHACATAAQFPGYEVIPADGGPLAHWPRFGGW
jgi:D-serine deaminase-like pyridoxal phosphate-dependent protein